MDARRQMVVQKMYQAHHAYLAHTRRTKVDIQYQIRVSHDTVDRDWDDFLAQTRGGHHVQTSLWARVKSLLGWQAVRLVVMQDDHIVAGAQLLLRPFAVGGRVGFVSKGPVFAVDDPGLANLLVKELFQVVKACGISILIVQPPNTGGSFASLLPYWGFSPTSIEVAPAATVLLDLSPDLDKILARMKKKTRRYIRHGLCQGIIGREGNEHDLSAFYQLHLATSQRQKWPIYPKQYFDEIWDVFGRHGQARLFLCEYQGEVVSTQLVIGFGDTVIAKTSGWSGHHSSLGPNQVLEWTTIQWAKSHGYRFYDLEGIDVEAAKTLLRGSTLPDAAKQSWFYYKLQYGGQVTLFPNAYVYVCNPALRGIFNRVFPKVEHWSVLHTFLHRLRTR
jgi:lipid II:glycine glycyltransferase (peptidoglycan interpeptide bridge formation enzyme)